MSSLTDNNLSSSKPIFDERPLYKVKDKHVECEKKEKLIMCNMISLDA